MQGKIVLVVDDDVAIRRITERVFQRSGAVVHLAADGKEALQKFFQYRPELVILDIMLPNENGWDICREIRKLSEVPIIMLTALNRDDDIIHSLEAGADEFVTKPFNNQVLLARSRAILRRSQLIVEASRESRYQDKYLSIDLKERKIEVQGQAVKLSQKEYRLLEYLLRYSNHTLTFNQILENVWGWEYKDNPDYVHVYMSHLRQKIEEDPRQPKYLLSEHGVGYRFQKKFN
jgi:DNA-binding response OmpR family regulator